MKYTYEDYIREETRIEKLYTDSAPHCDICGAKLINIKEIGEAYGSPYTLDYWSCPNCD